MSQLFLYDTTLRDGTQREDISLSCDDKLTIARRLDQFGIHYIEAGWPGSNPKDAEFFERARTDLRLKQAMNTRILRIILVRLIPLDQHLMSLTLGQQ